MPVMQPDDYGYHQTIKTFASEAEPAFEHPEEQRRLWGRAWGCSNDVGTLRVVLLFRPSAELTLVDTARWDDDLLAYADREAGWYWRGRQGPDVQAMQAQHDHLAEVLRHEGVHVEYVTEVLRGKIKQSSTRDQIVAVKGGAIVCRLGPRLRRGEEVAAARHLATLGMPILRTIHGTGIFEGGSLAFLNEQTAVVGVGARANPEGARQVEEVLRAQGVDMITVELPGYRQHIDGGLVMLDIDTALINPTVLPFWFLQKLRALKIRTIEVHHEDEAFTVNCLAVRPGRVIMSETSKRTLDRLDKAGIEIIPIDFAEVYRGGGGIHCSTAPLVRDPI